MKVLLLTQVLPYPPDSGPKVKTWNVLKYLAQHHEITLLSFIRGDQSAEVEVLRQYCKTVYTVQMKRTLFSEIVAMLRSLITGQPWIVLRDDRIAMRRLVDKVVKGMNFDVVHADQLNMAQYAMRVPCASKVLDAHNALWLLYKRLWETMPNSPRKWLLGRDWHLLKQYEGRVCREFEAVLAVSKDDKRALMDVAGKGENITVIPIAVDTDELRPMLRHPDANHILYIGTMYWPPNIDGVFWFIREVYPRIRARRPDVVFDIVGARPPRELLGLSDDQMGINVVGYVADPTPYIEKAGVMVVPLRAGGGMRVKILEALAQQLPVVTTTLGCEGIAVESGHHLIIADGPEAFAQATLSVLADKGLAWTLGQNGRRLIERQYDYRMVCQPLEQVYRNSIEHQRLPG